jgi:hypothetical protein
MNWTPVLKALVMLTGFVVEQLVKAGHKNIVDEQLKILEQKGHRADEARKNSFSRDDAGELFNNDGYKRD